MKINIDTITRASKQLIGNIIRTPTIRSQHLSSEINGEVFLKLENLQYTSSFKVRGAYTSITRLKEDQKKVGVIAMSAGNHAQAVAWWAKKKTRQRDDCYARACSFIQSNENKKSRCRRYPEGTYFK